MRERTTWNRREIARMASQRTAEDPRAMNQDHLQQQPAADAYVTGGPSEFAEDVHPSADTWEAEYVGGQVDRNEIGMPEFRDDTFKAASMDTETLHKKAEVCVKIARDMLGNVGESIIEDQALAFMHLPDVELVETATRLAKGKVPPEFLEQQKGEDKDEDEDEGQQKSASEWTDSVVQAVQAGDQQAIQSAIQGMIQSMLGQQAQQQQVQQQQAQQQQVQQQQAQQQQAQQQAQQQQVQQQQAQQQQAQQQQAQQQQAQQQQLSQQQVQKQIAQQVQQQLAQQVQQMVQQALQQMGLQQAQQQPQQAAQGCQGGQGCMSDDQMIDDMLMGQPSEDPEMDVQLEGLPMDIGEVEMGAGDEILSAIFASDPEVQQAQQALSIQTGLPQQVQASVRTASTRTVGTHPTGGVSQIGGAALGGGSGSELDKLSSLWRSAPDVKDVFGS